MRCCLVDQLYIIYLATSIAPLMDALLAQLVFLSPALCYASMYERILGKKNVFSEEFFYYYFSLSFLSFLSDT